MIKDPRLLADGLWRWRGDNRASHPAREGLAVSRRPVFSKVLSSAFLDETYLL